MVNMEIFHWRFVSLVLMVFCLMLLMFLEFSSLTSLLTQYTRNELEQSEPRPVVIFLAREEDWKQMKAFESSKPIQRTPSQTNSPAVEEEAIMDVNDLIGILNAQIGDQD